MTNERNASDLDKILGQSLPVLDKGFVRVVDYMGNESSIVRAARVSYGKGTKTLHEDQGLLRYLMKHQHTTPFEMCVIQLHIKCPLFVARQWVRHRTASINEESARYSIIKDEFYIPEIPQIQSQSKKNKQGREDTEMSYWTKKNHQETIKNHGDIAYKTYTDLLYHGEPELEQVQGVGVSRELSRMVLPQNIYTQFYWQMNLHNLLHFLKLRCDSHAQYEIRKYAWVILDGIVKQWVPTVHKYFKNYILFSKTLSYQQIKAIHFILYCANDPAVYKEAVDRMPRLKKDEKDDLKEILSLEGTGFETIEGDKDDSVQDLRDFSDVADDILNL